MVSKVVVIAVLFVLTAYLSGTSIQVIHEWVDDFIKICAKPCILIWNNLAAHKDGETLSKLQQHGMCLNCNPMCWCFDRSACDLSCALLSKVSSTLWQQCVCHYQGRLDSIHCQASELHHQWESCNSVCSCSVFDTWASSCMLYSLQVASICLGVSTQMVLSVADVCF